MENVKQIIKNAAYESFNFNRGNYQAYDLETLQNLANGFWEDRSDREIERDKDFGAEQDEYRRWVELEWANWLDSQKDELEITSISDLENWGGVDITGKYDFKRDLYVEKDNTLHFSLPLSHQDDAINFIFEVVELNSWDSILRIKEIHQI